MDHTIFFRLQLNKSTERHNADNLTGNDLARLNVSHNALDDALCFLDHLFVGTADCYVAFLGNVDLHAGLLDDLVDHAALLTNHIADLLRVDADLVNLRSIFANFFSRLRDCRFHAGIHDEESCLTASCDRTLYDWSGQSVDLDIHLDCSDTIGGTGYLKVHIAEEILKALDIS